MPSSSTTALVAGGALLVAGLSFWNRGRQSRELAEIDEDDDCITADEVCKVFDRLYLEMNQVFAALANQIRQIQMSGQHIPEAQVRAAFRSEMSRALKGKEAQLVEEMDMDQDCFEEATWEFLEEGDEKVKKAVQRLQELWQTATGEEVVGWRPGKQVEAKKIEDVLPAGKLIEVAEAYFDALRDAMIEQINEYKADGKDLSSVAVQQQLNMEFMQKANDVGESALMELGTSQAQFENSVKAHSNDPQVAQALAMLQMRNQQQLAELSSS